MHTTFSSILKHQRTVRIAIPTTRTLFTQPPTKKTSAYAVKALTATLAATTAIACNKDKDAKKEQTASQVQSQAHQIFYNYITGISSHDLIEPAKILGFYGCHSDGHKKFFRGEKLPRNAITEMEKNLGTTLELKRNTSITTSPTVADNFTNPPFLESIKDVFLIHIMGMSKHEKRIPILYDIKIPKDFKFIKIPNGVYLDFSDDSGHCLREFEYVIPMGTLIKITKSDSKENHYTIHVL
jgi:hypothetical protein